MKIIHRNLRLSFFYTILVVFLISSCKNKVDINTELTKNLATIENEMVAFRINSNTDALSQKDLIPINNIMGTSSHFSIYEFDQNNKGIKKLIPSINQGSEIFPIKLSKEKDYLAIKPISREAKARYELIHTLDNMQGITITPDICHYILCSPDVFHLNDLISRFAQLEEYSRDIKSQFLPTRYPPSPLALGYNNICDLCAGGRTPVYFDPKDIDVFNPTSSDNDICVCEPDTTLSDYDILKILYDANPNNSLSWDLNDKTMHSWKGVVLVNGKVRALYAREANLSVIPPEIGLLCNLISLEFYNNNITSIPPEMGDLFKLEQLSFNTNKLTSLPVEIGKLRNLEELLLNGNNLQTIPQEITQLNKIKLLNLAFNELTSIPNNIGDLRTINYLNLAQNNMNAIPESIKNFTNLIRLDLRENPVTNIPIEICNLQDSDTNILLDKGDNPAYPADSCN